MAAPRNTVCAPWATAEDVSLCDESKYEALDPYVLADALLDASSMLWRKTGKRYPGICQDLVRPPAGRRYATRNAPVWMGGGYFPDGYTTDGVLVEWRGFSGFCHCDRPTTRCVCHGPPQITLGRTPIAEVLEVLVDGDTLDPSCYRVDDFRWLVRLPDPDGTRRSWPCWQRMDLPASEPGTFAVLFSYGRMPPPELIRAAARFAGELALDRCGQECDLPDGITRASRENLDFAVITPTNDVWAQMPLSVRLAVDGVNPNGLRSAPKAWSPDLDPNPGVRPDTAS